MPSEAKEHVESHFGAMSVYIAAGHQAICNGQTQRAVALVAGLGQADWDGRCTTPPPGSGEHPLRW